MQLANQLELCLHEQTQVVASAACRVGSQEFHSWIASLPLVSLLFIVIIIIIIIIILVWKGYGKIEAKCIRKNY